MKDERKTKKQLIEELGHLRRQAAEASIRGHEETARTLLNLTVDSILLLERDGAILYINEIAAQRLGKKANELIGTNIFDIFSPQDVEIRRARQREILQARELLFFEEEWSGIILETSVYPILNERGEVERVAIFAKDITERKKMEEALRESEESVRAVMDAIHDTLFMIDPDGRCSVLNKAGARRLGKKVDEIIGKSVYDLIPPALAKERKAKIDEVFRSGKPARFEDERNGILFDNSIYPAFDSSGRVERVAVFASVITERKEAEQKLQESEERYRLLAENATDSIWIRDMNMRHTYVSPAVTRLRGFSVEEAMAQSVEETLTPASLEVVRKAWAEEMTFEEMEEKYPGRTRTLELEQYCKDGSTVWTEVEMIFLRDEEGRPTGILGCTRDITERKNFEVEREKYAERLEYEVYKRTLDFKKSEAKYRDLIEKMNEGVITLDAEMKVSFVNPAFLRMVGYQEKEVLGKHFTDVPWADDEAMSIIAKESEKRRKLRSSRYEVRARHKTGKIVHALASVTPIKGPDGEFAGSYAVLTDISEQKKLEQARKELSTRLVDLQEQERRRIACELHDEIGGLLTGVAIELELLSHEPDMRGKVQSNHLTSLRDQLHKTIDSVQRVSYELRPAILDDLGLPSALRWYVDTFCERTSIKARLRMEASLERLPEAVEIAVFRITQEALTNVAKHSKAESVSLILSMGKNNLSLIIKDNGVGFDPGKLYGEPEERGFGIFGIRDRLRSLGGNLDLQSEPGEGTRLVVTIPLGSG